MISVGNGFVTPLLVALASLASVVCHAQSASAPPGAPESEAAFTRSIEDLNLVGAAVTMPPFSDSLLGVDSGFRRSLFSQGMLLRVNLVPRYSQNLLDGPAPSAQQVYIGHRPTFISGVNPIFTADLRQLGLRQAQLNVGFGWRYSSWEPAGPNTLAMTSLYLFKGWGGRRVEVKAGYLGNDVEFAGLRHRLRGRVRHAGRRPRRSSVALLSTKQASATPSDCSSVRAARDTAPPGW